MDIVVKESELEGRIFPPPSKSYTHRALIAASLSPKSKLKNCLFSEDTFATLKACKKIGASFMRKDCLIVRGVDSICTHGYFYLANSGTTLRFLLSLLSLSSSGKFSILDGDASLRKRPNGQLVKVLKDLGAKIRGYGCHGRDRSVGSGGYPPIWVKGILKGGKASMENATSSQFISSLLFSLPLARHDSELTAERIKSSPYIDVTLHVLEESGIRVERVERDDQHRFLIEGNQSYRLRSFSIPSDFSSISYLLAAGLIAGKVRIENVFDSRQGDRRIAEICREMGGRVRERKEILVAEKSELEGITVDASDIPDLVPTIAILASMARGKTEIYNAEHLRHKEIDRLEGIYRNLKALGVDVSVRRDGLTIKGGKESFKGVVNSFGDHRMALAFSLLGLRGEVVVRNAEAIAVSYPSFFDDLRKLGGNIIEFRE